METIAPAGSFSNMRNDVYIIAFRLSSGFTWKIKGEIKREIYIWNNINVKP